MAELISFDELARHNRQDDLWILINDQVYDVSQYMNEHPPGGQVLLDVHGKDATDDFNDIGHSDEAKELMRIFYIGDIDQLTVPYPRPPPPPPSELTMVAQESGSGNKAFKFLMPILIIVISMAALLILNKSKQQD